MSVDFEKFRSWAETRFSPIEIRGQEICINSIFTEDTKTKLWCNPSGGKRKIKNGVYHCWKTDNRGTLVTLVMKVDNCDRKTAMQTLGIEGSKFESPDELQLDFSFETQSISIDYEGLFKEIPFPLNIHPLELAPSFLYQRAQSYLLSRKINRTDFFIGSSGRYENRIIIPYYSPNKKLTYYNGRALGDAPLRYLGPPKEIGAGKDDVLYFPHYPSQNDTIYLCEGEFDAMSLAECGLNSAACGGKYLSNKQATILSPYKVVLALDADEAGQSAKEKMKNTIQQFSGSYTILHVTPPEKYKDWNKFLVETNPKIVCAYIEYNTKELESETPYGYNF